MSYPKVASLRTAEAFRAHVASLGVELPLEDDIATGPDGPLAQAMPSDAGTIGNRFAILPMEGWDGDRDGRPTDLTRRRWRNFGLSGAKLIWGGEAVAVRPDGRANPNQLMLLDETAAGLEALREELLATHQETFGATADLVVGLQLTHSGRFARPNEKSQPEPRVAYRHPLLDRRVHVDDDAQILSDAELDRLVEDFVRAAKMAQQIGFTFVDVKHCHGYLGHELLSAYDRPGRYGGDFEGRTRFLQNIVAGIRTEAPGLAIGVRLSVFDFAPFSPGDDRVGVAEADAGYSHAFGGDGSALGIDLDEPARLLNLLEQLGVRLICTTAGSPYYNPHIQRPAAFPPSDGYLPPEDPLVGVARQISATAELKRRCPSAILVGSGYSYLQDWLPNVAQAVVRNGGVDAVGLGRVVLSYPDLPADVLGGKPLSRRRVCRTFSDCTTAPRNGMVSGCYPLDPFYKSRPERARLAELTRGG